MLTHSFSHIGNRYWWISPLHYKGFTPNSPSAMLGALESHQPTGVLEARGGSRASRRHRRAPLWPPARPERALSASGGPRVGR